VLRRFQERSALKTYLTSVITHAFQDFRNSAWGKWRPSAQARRLGPTAILLEQQIVRDGLTFDEACEQITTNRSLPVGKAELESIVGRLPVRFRRRMEPEDALRNVTAPGTADRTVKENEQLALRRRIWACLSAVIAALPAEDAAILALRFKSGKKVSEIAMILGVAQKPLYNRVSSLLAHLRESLEAQGVDTAVIGDFLNEDV
jgi:RNA polymerase sigma factor (sigma-70 family)